MSNVEDIMRRLDEAATKLSEQVKGLDCDPIEIPIADTGVLLVGVPNGKGGYITRQATLVDVQRAAKAVGLELATGPAPADRTDEIRQFMERVFGIGEDGGVRPWRDFEGRLVGVREMLELNELLGFGGSRG